MPVVLVIVMSAFNLLLLSYAKQPFAYLGNITQVAFADHELVEENIEESEVELQNLSPIDPSSAFFEEAKPTIIEGSYLVNDNNPLSNVLPTRGGLLLYKVQKGDNLSRIAANFGISVNTILWANKKLDRYSLTPGQEITLLPVSGVLHEVQLDETIESIANLYSVAAPRIIKINPSLASGIAELGSIIIIPDGKPLKGGSYFSVSDLPDLAGYFAIPTTGWNWGKLHDFNAIDIANVCGTPVYAAAEGLIIEEESSGWNYGYGEYIVIEHPNSTQTKYAHLQKNVVTIGDYVSKGDLISYMGNTGKTDGPTGCHLHFIVRGAKNPFSK